MKEIIGLLVFFTIAGSAVVLAVSKRTGNTLTAILLLFSMASGWGISNYDWIQTIEWQVPGLEVFQNQVQFIKEEAVEDLCNEVEVQKASIDMLLFNAEKTHEEMAARKEAMESLLAAVSRLEESIRAQEEEARELNDKAQKMEGQLVAIHHASSELALLLTRVIWLQFEARDEYGAEHAQAAVQKVMDGLDEIVNLVIVDPKARKDFIKGVMSSIPSRR